MIALILGLLLQVAQTPEEMYQEYITPETQAILDRQEEAMTQLQEAQEAEGRQKTLALVLSIAIALVPMAYIGILAARNQSWKNNPEGTRKALGIGLLGALVLFGINYGIFMLKIRAGDAFNTGLAFLLVVAITIGAVFLLKKKE